jgi:membrane protease YdiL (CAAX protease family)
MAFTIRTYVGPSVFILYFSLWVVWGSFFATGQDSRAASPFPILLLIAVIIILAVLYRMKATTPQKEFITVAGEVYLCFIVVAVIALPFLWFDIKSVSMLTNIMGILVILGYHFVVNKKTIEDLGIKDISKDVEFIIVGAIALFCLYGAINFQRYLEEGFFHIPAFEELVTLFLVVVGTEIGYRYYMVGKGIGAFGKYGSVLVVTFLMVVVHLISNPSVLPLVYYTVSQIVLGLGYVRGKNLSIPLILHILVKMYPLWLF